MSTCGPLPRLWFGDDDVTPGPCWSTLKASLSSVLKMISGDEVNLLDTTKEFASATVTLKRALDDSDFQSMRYRAACKAINLKTPKSELVSFLDERVGAGP